MTTLFVTSPTIINIFGSLVNENIYQSNTHRKDLIWPHFDDEPRVQEKQQVKDQKSGIFVFVACLTIPSSN